MNVLKVIFDLMKYISSALQASLYVVACAQANIKSTLKSLRRFNIRTKINVIIKTLKIHVDLENLLLKMK